MIWETLAIGAALIVTSTLWIWVTARPIGRHDARNIGKDRR